MRVRVMVLMWVRVRAGLQVKMRLRAFEGDSEDRVVDNRDRG